MFNHNTMPPNGAQPIVAPPTFDNIRLHSSSSPNALFGFDYGYLQKPGRRHLIRQAKDYPDGPKAIGWTVGPLPMWEHVAAVSPGFHTVMPIWIGHHVPFQTVRLTYNATTVLCAKVSHPSEVFRIMEACIERGGRHVDEWADYVRRNS